MPAAYPSDSRLVQPARIAHQWDLTHPFDAPGSWSGEQREESRPSLTGAVQPAAMRAYPDGVYIDHAAEVARDQERLAANAAWVRPGPARGRGGARKTMITFDETYRAMLAADMSGDTGEAARLAEQAADVVRASDAGARNRALLGPRSARERNRSLVGRPRGPMGQAS